MVAQLLVERLHRRVGIQPGRLQEEPGHLHGFARGQHTLHHGQEADVHVARPVTVDPGTPLLLLVQEECVKACLLPGAHQHQRIAVIRLPHGAAEGIQFK